MNRCTTSSVGLAALALAVASIAGSALMPAQAFLAPGTPAKDVHIGLDNDNAANPFVQPPGVRARQHMRNTDILVGRANDDLLIGNKGADTLLANSGDDILVGGADSDVLLAESGDDVSIWAPGDASDAFVGHTGDDTMIFGPLLEEADGSARLEDFYGRRIPRVDMEASAQLGCTVVVVPVVERLGFDVLVRVEVGGVLKATVRGEDVESVYCPSPDRGKALVADLTTAAPAFRPVRLADVRGLVGAIVAPKD